MNRLLYLVCYDIRDPRRLARVGRFLKGYKVSGQKSLCECWLTPAELREVEAGLKARMDLARDRSHLFALDARQTPILLGKATPTPLFFTIL